MFKTNAKTKPSYHINDIQANTVLVNTFQMQIKLVDLFVWWAALSTNRAIRDTDRYIWANRCLQIETK